MWRVDFGAEVLPGVDFLLSLLPVRRLGVIGVAANSYASAFAVLFVDVVPASRPLASSFVRSIPS